MSLTGRRLDLSPGFLCVINIPQRNGSPRHRPASPLLTWVAHTVIISSCWAISLLASVRQCALLVLCSSNIRRENTSQTFPVWLFFFMKKLLRVPDITAVFSAHPSWNSPPDLDGRWSHQSDRWPTPAFFFFFLICWDLTKVCDLCHRKVEPWSRILGISTTSDRSSRALR